MGSQAGLTAFLFVISLTFFLSSQSNAAVNANEMSKQKIAAQIAALNIPFIQNDGQTDGEVSFYAKTFDGTVFVTNEGEIVYTLMKNKDETTATGLSFKEDFIGGNINDVNGEEEAITKVSYFKGNDSSEWRTQIPSYGVVNLGDVYRGVDVKLKAYGHNVEKIFYVGPGAKPKNIQMRISGAKTIKINKSGELEVSSGFGTTKFTKPVAYQIKKGKTIKVAVAYRIINKAKLIYGFSLGSYDKKYELVIDPLLASTFLGGSRSDLPWSVAIDSVGDIYVAGYTESIDFPTTLGAFEISFMDFTDAFVSKFNSDLTMLLASTFLGGLKATYAWGIALDASNEYVYVTGNTYSYDFPTTTGSSHKGDADVFVAKLNSDLSGLAASTFLGGSGFEQSYAITLDPTGDVFIAGYTQSSDFPSTTGRSFSGGADAFVLKLSNDLATLQASTLLGGKKNEYIRSIVLDPSGNIYAAGNTYSSDFPTTAGAYDISFNTVLNGGIYTDAFISKLSGDLTVLIASTFLGGTNEDYVSSVILDSSGNVYVAGYTYSSDFPVTPGAYDTSFNTSGIYADAFVSKLNGDLTTLLASTFLGGSKSDYAGSITIDSSGNVYATGNTYSSDFPTTIGAFDTVFNGNADVFVSKLRGDLTGLLASTFLGGSSYEDGWTIAIDPSGNICVAGNTYSSDFPTTAGAFDTSFSGDADIFISKFDIDLSPNP